MGFLNMALLGVIDNAQNTLLYNLFIVMSLLEMVAITCVFPYFIFLCAYQNNILQGRYISLQSTIGAADPWAGFTIGFKKFSLR